MCFLGYIFVIFFTQVVNNLFTYDTKCSDYKFLYLNEDIIYNNVNSKFIVRTEQEVKMCSVYCPCRYESYLLSKLFYFKKIF